MPRALSLAAYAIKVRDVGEREDEIISDFAEGEDLLDFFQQFFGDLKDKKIDDKIIQQVLSVETLKVEGRKLYGIVETGEYGEESVLWDVERLKVAHRRKKTEAEMLPFYFHLDLPEGTDEGILLLQRLGAIGIRQLLHFAVSRAFEKKHADHRLLFLPLVEPKEVEKYVKGRIESIRFIRFGIPSDLSDAYDAGHKEEGGYVELVVHARRGSNLPVNNRLKQFFEGRREIKDLIALDETKFKYDNIKVRSRVGASSRTINLASPKRLRSYYDISETVRLDAKTGHPKFDSIHTLAEEIVGRIKSTIYKE